MIAPRIHMGRGRRILQRIRQQLVSKSFYYTVLINFY